MASRQGGFFFNNNNTLFFYPFGFQWRDIPLPDKAFHQLKFYVYVNNATCIFTARISDGSSPDASVTVTNASAGEYIITLNVQAANFGATLSVTWMSTVMTGSTGAVGVEAVTMA